MTSLAPLLPVLVFPPLVTAAALKDVTSYTIPNWISLAAAGLFLPVALLVGAPLGEVGAAVGVGVLALAAGVGLFALGWFGGGDAKLMAACALWIGFKAALTFLFWTSVAGGVLALALLSARTALQSYAFPAPLWLRNLMAPKGDVPYGAAIAVGALAAFPHSVLLGG